MRGIRPAALTTPCSALGAVAVAMHVISRTTGSGWLVVVVSFLLGLLALSAVLPVVALAGMDVDVRGPADATVGRPVTTTVTVRGRARGVQLRLSEPSSSWVRVDGPGPGTVQAVPARRGIVDQVEVEVRSASPFGLVWWRRRLVAPLERPLEVGPSPLEPEAAPEPDAEAVAGDAARAATAPELPRGVRDYVSGDPPRLVSWVATARQGRLMVREMEGGSAVRRITVVVDLREVHTAEEGASRAAGLAVAALRQGTEVVLATAEATGPRLGPVTSAVEVGRRLARATGDGPPASPQEGTGVVVVGRSG